MTTLWPFLVLQVVIFVTLVVVLRHVMTKNLVAATAHLQGLNAEYARRHEELKTRLEEAGQQYREQMAKAKTEAEQLVVQAKQDAEASRSRLLEEARHESERIVQQGLESRDGLRRELEEQMERRAIERACELLHDALPEQLRQTIQAFWVEELIQNGLAHVERLPAEERVQEARVVSAFPLNATQRAALKARLKDKLGREIDVKEETNDRLVAGLTITLGNLVLDGSLSSKVQQAIRHAQNLS